MKFEIEFYESISGEQPAKEFILSFEKKMIAKTLDMLKLLQDNVRLRSLKNIGRTIWPERRVAMSNKFDDFLQEQLRDSEIRKEYERLQPEHAVIQAMIDARQKSGMTQKELAERTGIAQSDISKLEHGNANPSIRTLQRLARGMGMILKIEFAPEKASATK